MSFGSCEVSTQDTRIVLEEKHSKVTFINTTKGLVRKIRIDDCVIKDGKRCDYLLLLKTGNYYFVELKGSDVDYASVQIEETLKKIDMHDARNIYGFIITSRCPLSSTEIQILAKKMIKKKCLLRVLSSNREVELF